MNNKERIFNPLRTKSYRSKLRRNLTEPEKKLWYVIRNKQLGIKFRRQHGISNFIVDFYCSELKLVLEIDGDSHYSPDNKQADLERDKYIVSLGLTVLRFSNLEIMQNLEGVLVSIIEFRDKFSLPI